MTPACYKLFAYAVNEVTPRDVWDFSPNDPGFPGYVREFTAILKSRKLPQDADFDITETIGLTMWGDAETEKDPVRFRRFRVFTNSVGVALCAGPAGPPGTMVPNYLVIRLLEDSHALQDAQLLRLLYPVFADLHARLKHDGWFDKEAPLLLLGQLMLALMGYADPNDVPALAAKLVKMGSIAEHYVSSDFLWSGTNFDQLHAEWKRFVGIAFPENSPIEDVALLRDALLE
ncbi:hypothetical protein [Verrucomicrobium sp. BvORR034]|uniref:hypothetical protein n=1 Tax=Verrucomicrobium sp. BvORR034 TaxID=1396418 RepID=UPI000679B0DD|nr:hypothetical protein [Verrucomicrobium sp. BvORR034]